MLSKKQNIKVIYYISPQIWAWDEKRVHQIKKNVDLMLCILPFEEDFYKKYDYAVKFVGHPLLDVIKIQDFDENNSVFIKKTNKIDKNIDIIGNFVKKKPIIALLPGSRKQEVLKMLDKMLSIAPQFPDYQFVIAGAASLDEAVYIPDPEGGTVAIDAKGLADPEGGTVEID